MGLVCITSSEGKEEVEKFYCKIVTWKSVHVARSHNFTSFISPTSPQCEKVTTIDFPISHDAKERA